MDKFPDIPDYRIEKKLGRGRIVDVFLAVDQDTRETVILKVLLPELIEDEKFAKRFLYESRKAAKLEHPNIVEILDVGETPEHYYIVTEYFRGSLRDRLNELHPGMDLDFAVTGNNVESGPQSQATDEIPAHEILDIFRQLFDALDYAHNEDAVHRDIRPENIFFREDGTPVLADFQVAELVRSSDVLRKMAVRPNMPHYTSPEQTLKKPVDRSSDIYSLGVTLFEVLTGHPPFDAAEVIAIEKMHVTEPVPRLPEQFSLFQPLIDRMMAKAKEERADNGAELILFMEELSDQLPESTPEDQFQIEQTAEEPVEELPMQKVQVESSMVEDLPVPETPVPETPVTKRPEPWHTGTPGHIDSVDDIVKIATISAEGKLKGEATDTAGSGETEDMGVDLELELPPARERTHKFKTVEKSDSEGISDLLEKLREPKILGAAVGGIVIIVLLIIFILPSGDTGEPEAGETAQKSEASLTPEEIKERDMRYKRKFDLALKEFKAERYDKAMQQLKAAEKIKFTKELETLKGQIEAKNSGKKDDNAFAKASGTDTAAAYEEYLKAFPSGRHAEEAQKKIDAFTEIERKREAQRKKWAASRIKLRATPQTLAKAELRTMLKQRGFFEKYYNRTGSFQNHFELQVIDTQKVVVDYATGLMWHQDGSKEYMDYSKAGEWINSLNQGKYAGFSDWRLPTMEEVASLLENKENRYNLFIDAVFSRTQKYIWTCDKFSDIKTWALDFYGGDVNPIPLTYTAFIRPVRTHE